MYQGGRTLYGFAEEGVPWEAFISGKPEAKERSKQIWAETGERLGLMQGIRDALSGGGRGGAQSIVQKNEIHMYDRDERTVMKRVNRSLMEAVNS